MGPRGSRRMLAIVMVDASRTPIDSSLAGVVVAPVIERVVPSVLLSFATVPLWFTLAQRVLV